MSPETILSGKAAQRAARRHDRATRTSLLDHLPALRTSQGRGNANRRLPVLLRMRGLRSGSSSKGGRLLRILFLWVDPMPANANRPPSGDQQCCTYLRAARMQAIKADISSRLGDGDLSVSAVAARHGVTSRYVHKLFETEGATFSEYVLARRLELAHRLLTDPRFGSRSIASIALDAGFSDLSHFNRTFVDDATPRRPGREPRPPVPRRANFHRVRIAPDARHNAGHTSFQTTGRGATVAFRRRGAQGRGQTRVTIVSSGRIAPLGGRLGRDRSRRQRCHAFIQFRARATRHRPDRKFTRPVVGPQTTQA
jgi:AraC-like DNA-binding protein